MIMVDTIIKLGGLITPMCRSPPFLFSKKEMRTKRRIAQWIRKDIIFI